MLLHTRAHRLSLIQHTHTHALPRLVRARRRTTTAAPPPPAAHARDTQPETLQQEEQDLGASKPCLACGSTQHIQCSACGGVGHLPRGGYSRKQSLPKDLINSKWTAMAQTVGWRHFRVKQLQKKAKGLTFCLMQASCDPNAEIWVNRESLKSRSLWAAGWVQMSVVKGMDPEASKGPPCRGCSGSGKVACSSCVRLPRGSRGSPLIQL